MPYAHLLAAALALAPVAPAQGQVPAQACRVREPIPAGASAFTFSGWAGPALPVELYRPARAAADARIVFVMHGVRRDGDRYRDEWKALAEQHGFVVVVPTFTAKDFPESEGYNLGNLFDADDRPVPRERWSFSAIEPVFEAVRCRLDGRQRSYALYGHSAGGQFVHRFVQFMPTARYDAAVAANSGWYTMPDPAEAFPYGLGGKVASLTKAGTGLDRPLTILLGTADTDRNDPSLRKTARADRQGLTRFARGQSFYKASQARAKATGKRFAWQLAYAPGVAHDNGKMAPFAVPFLLGEVPKR